MLDLEPAALVDAILADSPAVHPQAPRGVWDTERSCYELLASWLRPEHRTIETGCGVSTAVFAARRAQHTCLTVDAGEADVLRQWSELHGVPLDRVSFEIGGSEEVLPTLEPTPLDVVFIDGEHVYPLPVIDWYYTVRRLVVGGLVVVDDVQLPAPRLVADYMATLASYRCLERTPKWAAFELALEPPPPESWRMPKAGTTLIPGGRFEQWGRRADRAVARILDRRSGREQ